MEIRFVKSQSILFKLDANCLLINDEDTFDWLNNDILGDNDEELIYFDVFVREFGEFKKSGRYKQYSFCTHYVFLSNKGSIYVVESQEGPFYNNSVYSYIGSEYLNDMETRAFIKLVKYVGSDSELVCTDSLLKVASDFQ